MARKPHYYGDLSEEEEELLSSNEVADSNEEYSFSEEEYLDLVDFVFAKANFKAGPHTGVRVSPAELMRIIRESNKIDKEHLSMYKGKVKNIIATLKWGEKQLSESKSKDFTYYYKKEEVTQSKKELINMIEKYYIDDRYVITEQNYEKALDLSNRLRTIFPS